MRFVPGIRTKLFGWYFVFLLIFYGTLLALYLNIHQMMEITEKIVNRQYRISSAAKKMGESLLNMEEAEKKFLLLKNKEYLERFLLEKTEFESNLANILQMLPDEKQPSPWRKLAENYQQVMKKTGEFDIAAPPEGIWLSEASINHWIDMISSAKAANEEQIVLNNVDLNRRGQAAVKNGMIGLALSTLVGLVWSLFLVYSTIRPLRILARGIRAVSSGQLGKPISINSRDEFGEVSRAFNEMALRLQEEEDMRADFISMLSHEIRTPLTSIRESVNMIAEEVMGSINDRQRKFLKIASSEIGRISDLLNHLMQVTRLESHAIKIEPRAVAPLPLITGCIERIQPAAALKKIRIKLAAPPELTDIIGDPKALQQTLLNLLGNAVKFCKNEGWVEIRTQENNNGSLKVCIADNGPGISSDEQKLIFNKYYRGRHFRNQMDGVGLGLSITKLIVEAHGGRLWVDSHIGEGSTFCFTLPTEKKRH